MDEQASTMNENRPGFLAVFFGLVIWIALVVAFLSAVALVGAGLWMAIAWLAGLAGVRL